MLQLLFRISNFYIKALYFTWNITCKLYYIWSLQKYSKEDMGQQCIRQLDRIWSVVNMELWFLNLSKFQKSMHFLLYLAASCCIRKFSIRSYTMYMYMYLINTVCVCSYINKHIHIHTHECVHTDFSHRFTNFQTEVWS